MSRRRVFPGEERQLGGLRRWLAALLPPSAARDDVVTVANELSSNAIQHTFSGRGGAFAVEVTWCGQVVRVAVADGGGPAEPREADDPAGVHGRGLLLVRGLSARWGVRGDHCGRLVWADVPWGDAGTAEPASPKDRCDAAIRDGEAGQASRFGVTTWSGSSASQWQAATGGVLVAAPSAQQSESLPGKAMDPRPHAGENQQ